ncbi:unnamed protein product, partial [Brassica oleracea]
MKSLRISPKGPEISGPALHRMQLKQRKESDRPLYQLHLMSKVKNIASLQLYGEEQAS